MEPSSLQEYSAPVPTEKLTQAFLFDGQQPWRTRTKDLEEINPIPSMIIPDEAQFLHYVAREHYKGLGAIVEFGPLGGGSTYALASGMAENSILAARNRRINSYDLWQFCGGWDDLFPGHALCSGDDLKEIFLENLKAFRSQIEPHKGDLAKQRWSGGPIEIMFIDAAKSPRLMTHIVNEFFAHLIPNRSLVIHQDYISAQCPWIHIIVQHLREYFEYMDSPAGGTVCMRLKRQIPSRLLAEDFFAGLSVSEARPLLADAREMIVGWYKLSVWLAEANYLASKGLASDALRIIDEVRAHPQFQPRVQLDIDLVIQQLLSTQRSAHSNDLFGIQRSAQIEPERGNGRVKAIWRIPTEAWRMLKNERARLGSWKTAFRSVGKPLVKNRIISIFGDRAFLRLKDIYGRVKEERYKRRARLPALWLGTKLTLQHGFRFLWNRLGPSQPAVENIIDSATRNRPKSAEIADPVEGSNHQLRERKRELTG